ncbi:MAG TPA: SIMPL domain-containing protein [Candidatus Limnocylindria bacterium]|nr:SIMPL domain-containing protein [Candidatus Limnocylindria bacterium]
MPPEEKTPSKSKLSFSLDMRIIIAVLLIIIAGMLAVWKPWASPNSNDRTVSVTGDATVKAEPDEYLFYPSYQFKGADKDATLNQLTKKSNAIVAELKKLGVQDSKIKTNSSGYGDYYSISRDPESDATTYTLSLSVTVGNKDLAQKAQDYLVTTSPTGAVTPQPTFSDAKRKELEAQARDQATKDARSKADQSAKNLGFKVGKVQKVSDGAGFGEIPYYGGITDGALSAAEQSKRQLTIQPGENDLRYSVTVIYYLR